MISLKIFYVLISLFVFKTFAVELFSADSLDICVENPGVLAESDFALKTIENIRNQIIGNNEVKQLLLGNPAELDKAKASLLKCTEELMKRSQFKVLEQFIEEVLDPLDLDLSNEMRLIGNQIKKEIDNIVNVAHAKRNIQIVTPVFQWIQSQSHLYLQIKFAHRHDAPGCLEVKNERIEFRENGFYFSAFGVQAQQPIHFLLNLTLFKEIIPEQSTWNLESVGRLFVSIAKANNEVWVYPLKNNEKIPGMRLWWEMKDAYKDATEEYERLLEEQESDSGSKKNKSKKPKKQEDPSLDDL